MISLSKEISIKDLKCFVLKTVNQAFYLKFHLQNDQKLADLERMTNEWNEKHEIETDDSFLQFDIFLDRVFYDLVLEVNT